MPKGLTTPQKSILVCAYRSGKDIADKVPPTRGEALERRGYGWYYKDQRIFRLNPAGRNYGSDGMQLEHGK